MFEIKLRAFFLMLATLLNFSIGALVYFKNRKNKLNQYLGLMALFSGFFTFGFAHYCLIIIFHYSTVNEIPHVWSNLFFAKFTFIGLFIIPSWIILILHLKAASAARIKLVSFLLYFPALVIFVLALFTPLMLKGFIFEYPN